MGFFKRILSLGSKSKKSKKKQNMANTRVDAEGRIVPEKRARDPDTSPNRLLRSSSTKFSVVSAIDYTSLPPMPQPVQDPLRTPPLSRSPSTLTVATTPGLQRSGTYVVKVHGRTTHSRTEFPLANPPASPTKPRRKLPPKTPERERHHSVEDDAEPMIRLKEVNFTPRDTSRMYTLRRDPSVASLLNLYDDQGCLDSKVFDNTPSSPALTTAPEGREPTKRTGSTLRQLLGEPELPFSFNSTAEGDISWAERFLGEQLGNGSPLSSHSSLELETPKDLLFSHTLSIPPVAVADTTLSSLDPDSSTNYPIISSMEVEVSTSEDDVPMITVSQPVLDPKTPQRASEVFGFLSHRNNHNVTERDLPPLPTITPEHTGDKQHSADESNMNMNMNEISLGETSDATHSANTSHSTQLTSSDTNSHASHAQIQTATMTKLSSAFAASTTSLNLLISQDTTKTVNGKENDEVVSNHVHADTTSVFMQAASHQTGSSLASGSSTKLGPTKTPRGPRPRPLSICERDVPSDSLGYRLTHISQNSGELSHVPQDQPDEHARKAQREALANIPQRQHQRVNSGSSGHGLDLDRLDDDRNSGPVKLPDSSSKFAYSRKRSTKPEPTGRWHSHSKENSPSPPPSRHASPGISSVPVLGHSMATPIRHRVLLNEPPSPASSSELSPVARDMMNDLRQQRMRARQLERRRGVWVRE